MTPEQAALAASVDAAWTTVGQRLDRSLRAEARRRVAEDAVVAAHRQRAGAAAVLAERRDALEAARAAHAAVVADLAAAQDRFDRSVAVSYKYSGAEASALLYTALKSAADAHDVARALHELDAILGHDYGEILDLTEDVAAAARRVHHLDMLRRIGALRLQQADAAIVDAETAAEDARAAARRTESALLDALGRELDAEQAVIDGGAESPMPPPMEDGMVLAALPDAEAPGAAVEATAADVAQRREWLANRRAALAAEAALPSDAWLVRPDVQCPLYEPEFVDDWHFPRSQGRRHLGTDLAAAAGTAVVAMFDGVVTTLDAVDAFDGDNDLAGISVSYTDGRTRVLAAHLDHIVFGLEEGRPVRAGEVIGYVGTSGNAQGGAPHLHLGWFVDGVAVNPYPSLVLACRDDDGSG